MKQITPNKHGAVKLLNCFDRNCEVPCSFKFGENFIESTPAKFVGIIGMKRIGSRKGQKLIERFNLKKFDENVLYNKLTKKKIMETIIEVMKKKKRRTKIDDEHVVCLIGFYLCCVLFFGDKNASAVNVKYLAIVETYETVLKVSWPDLLHEHLFEEILKNADCPSNVKACVPYLLILFAEHTPAGLIQKVQNNEQKIPRVGRWDVQVISDFIAGANMTELSVSVCYYLVYILFTITLKIACVTDIYT
ncbi:hypothetical protein MKW98_015491 [Papaver atlanticum]|uniref:Uncharacterized protein n=1 Tax=Papaver atlanticum TaxID=357466 RepID=A0AAD4RYY6_9MAGN|nr:hypothetical protein MKW98_015491 [Papaver atlanticum]